MTSLNPLFRFTTYPALALRATSGANEGDAIGLGDAALPGDTYRLSRRVSAERMAICDGPDGGQIVANRSRAGTPGDRLEIADCHTLMGPRGDLIEVLVLLRHGDDGEALHLLPLSPITPAVEYELIGSTPANAPERFADIASVSFLEGTHVTLSGGAQRKVEDLKVGDFVLTRDHGRQPIRWIGHQTRRATGAAAPIRITKGTLNCARDLRLSPQHRLFIWQRRDELGAGRSEVMVKADLLVNGTTVLREAGGHIDSYQLVFDGHEIIFAEGIAVESLLVTAETRARLPADLSLDQPGSDQRDAAGLELNEEDIDADVELAERLMRASRGMTPKPG